MSSVAPEYGNYPSDELLDNSPRVVRHIKPMAILIAKFQAYIQFRKIKKGLREVELMEKGQKSDKPIDQLLNEL